MNIVSHASYLHTCPVPFCFYSFCHFSLHSVLRAASSYLSSWSSGTPAAAGCAAGEDEDEAGCSGRRRRSAAPGGCCCSGRSRSCRGIRLLRGSPADPGPPRWRGSRWSRLSDGRCCGEPQGSPYWNGKMQVRWKETICILLPLWPQVCCTELPPQTGISVTLNPSCLYCSCVFFSFLFLSSLLSCSQSLQLWSLSLSVHTALLVNSVVCWGQRATSPWLSLR